MYSELVPFEAYQFFMVFARLSAVVLLMPTLGESYISPRVRLFLALGITLITTPIVADRIPPLPDSILALFLLIGGEILIGVFLGQVMRILSSALSTAGTVIAFVTGFANAMLFNPMISSQGSLHSVFLSMLGSVIILATDVHHLMIGAIVDSYFMFNPGVMPILGDMSNSITRLVADSFLMGMQLASPFLLLSIMYNVLLGLLARLMPQFQVFFIGLPLQIILGLALFGIVISSMMLWFMRYFTEGLSPFLLLN
ncbi:flagellar biosynthetic protein FliR [Aestuariispira insulae]|uniref:Flagellar biosynthetic protein FliR n=1 Tax=Aestuariispira insulae TaxID=1461337 RepID=A0A3D9HSL0_9PROT|nr:flagellar biosynthetic protein FliR [Aestuariispira insulae]RED52477.1 flagellar biosynthetic protein FliR [Aestuariispira insulae]